MYNGGFRNREKNKDKAQWDDINIGDVAYFSSSVPLLKFSFTIGIMKSEHKSRS